MNRFAKTVFLAMMLLVMPLKQWAQQPQANNNPATIRFDITDIARFDERVFFIYNLMTDGRFDVINDEQDGIFIVSASDAFEGISLSETFAEFKEQNAINFNKMDKEQAAEVAAEYKGELPNQFTSSLMMDYYIRSRQNNTCANADPFCTDNGMYEFPAGVNAGSGESGPDYDCLYSTPNPAWYYMRIANPGSITINMHSTPSVDIDFCCWGPYATITNPSPCSSLTSNKVVSCSYSTSANENCIIPSSAQTGDYFILIITNYSNTTCNISFSKTAGTGTTDCGILPPLVENDGPYCVGETIHLSANGQAGASYSWSGPDGWTSNQQNPTRTNCTMAMAGTYTCTITVGSQTNSATTTVVIHPQPTANFNATTVCLGDPTQFTNTSTTNPSGQTMSYQWNFGDGQTSTQQNPTHTYANAGTFTVTLTVTCNGHCTNTKTQTVTVYAQPAANAGPDQTVGYGGIAQLNGSGGAGTFNYHWEPANMVTNPNAQNTQTVALFQDQTYTLTVTSPQGGCSSQDQVTIHMNGSAMTVTAGPAISICQGGSGQIYVNAGGGTGNFTYSWTPTTGLSNPNIYNPIASPSQTTTYTCHVTDGQTTQNVTVTVTVNEVIEEHESMTICPDDVYHWHGQDYNEPNTYQIDTVTSQGCAKTIYLHLDHYPTYDETPINVAICHGETYSFGGNTFNASIFNYPDTLQTIHGCDSIVRLNLTVYPDNGVTSIPVTYCPEQCPYHFYGVDYYEDADVTVLDTDIHGCDSAVRLIFSVRDYYKPDTLKVFTCSLPYEWRIENPDGSLITTKTITEQGFYCDTLATNACEGIFQLQLNYQEIPEPEHIWDTVCNRYRWIVNGELVGEYNESAEDFFPVSLYPFPCTKDYYLHLVVNHDDNDADNIEVIDEHHLDYACDSIRFEWFGNTLYFKEDGVYPFPNENYHDGHTIHGCDTALIVKVRDMTYTPNPSKIRCSDGSAVVFGDTIAVVTNTEFFSFQYTFYVEETNRKCVWESCDWTISKPSWNIEFSPVPVLSLNGKYYSECTVYVADRNNEYVVLTATANNGCNSTERKFYLKSSFLDIDEYNASPAKVNIVPNPNNGQMHLDFENMDGRTAIKVFDMTGNQIDAFETFINSNRYNYDYNMKKYAEGIYFFVISNNNRVLTKKVVVIH